MGRQEQIIAERIKKINALKNEGINPYPHNYEVKNYSSELQIQHNKLKKGTSSKSKAKIAGRLISYRDFGKIAFGVIQDSQGRIQITLQKPHTPEKITKFFKKFIDTGDILGIEGTILRTDRGELSVLVKNASLLSKSILPLPEKWHGLQDDEEKLRKRYLDFIMNPEITELFIKRFKFWKATREYLMGNGFIEVETPVLETTPGGADARPFSTHHNALDMEVYLRISMGELWQKRLMVAGLEKTFEIGRQFRNEGMSSEHLQDYSQMEFYWAYADYNDGMKLVEEMYNHITKETLGTLKFKTRGFKINLSKPWIKIDYVSEIKKQTGIDFFKATKKDLISKLEQLNIEHDHNVEKERLIDLLWKHCRKKIAGPAFLVHHPVEISPLAKRYSKDNRLVERFIVILAGSELGNGYSELNDPQDQEERFKKQAELRDMGDEEAQMHDKDFVEALKYGMPPTCGFGFSERFFAFLMDKTVRECQIFPLMKSIVNKTEKNRKEVSINDRHNNKK
jgi:lysyl-tRNA synthetase, class II